MNDEKIIEEMISFIEEKERELQQKKLLADSQAKSDTINAIISKLEAKTNENK